MSLIQWGSCFLHFLSARLLDLLDALIPSLNQGTHGLTVTDLVLSGAWCSTG